MSFSYYMKYRIIFSLFLPPPPFSPLLSPSLLTTIQSLQIVNITICGAAKPGAIAIYHGVLSGYLFILFILVFILVLVTAKISVSSFQREHRATYRAIIFAVIPSSIITIVQTFLLIRGPSLDRTYLLIGLEACWTLLLIVLLLLVLFPSVS